jgi:Domain of unknown function (DUF4845)
MKRQRGVTFVGMVFIAGLIVFGAIVGLKLIPAYIEYATIVNHLRELGNSSEGKGTPKEVQSAFGKRAQIDDIQSVSPTDLEVIKEGNSVVLTLNYSTKIPLFGNLSACIDFAATNAP